MEHKFKYVIVLLLLSTIFITSNFFAKAQSAVIHNETSVTYNSATAAAADYSLSSWRRIAGQNRYQTAKQIAEDYCAKQVDAVVLVSGDDFSDTLSASVLAFQKNAPILFASQSVEGSKDALSYISAHLEEDGTLYVISRDSSFPAYWEKSLSNYTIKQLGGGSALETNLLINQSLEVEEGTPVFIASGEDFPDTLSAASIAAAKKYPILMVQGDSLTSEVKEYLISINPSAFYIVGEYGVVSSAIQNQVRHLFSHADIKRFGGYDRFDTCISLVKEFYPSPDTIYVTSGNNFVDASSGSVLAAKNNAPIILLNPSAVEPPLAADVWFNSLFEQGTKPQIVALGGERILTNALLETVKKQLNHGGMTAQRRAFQDLTSTDLVDLSWYIPSLIRDINYETTHNSGTSQYDPRKAYLRKGTADKLKAVEAELESMGLRLKIWNAYRLPTDESSEHHARGNAVDLTLVDFYGNELAMPSSYDNCSLKANEDYSDASNDQVENARLLETLMRKHGFNPLSAKWWHFVDNEPYAMITDPYSSSIPNSKPITREIITLSAVGDSTLGTEPRYGYLGSFTQYYDQHGPEYFLSGVQSTFASDDITLMNLETALTTQKELADKSYLARAYWFSGHPDYVKILQSGSVEIVNLANNHTYDFKEAGFKDTLKALDNGGIAYTGYGFKRILDKKGVKFGFVGYMALETIEEGAYLDTLKKEMSSDLRDLKDKTDVIIVSIHWGDENSYTPNATQKKLGHFLIDEGADLVVGHHPHVLQPIESYKGKTIIYSLGNFCFGGNFNPWDKDTMIFQQTYEVVNGEFWGISENRVIPARVSSSSSYNDYHTVEVNARISEESLIFYP